MKYGLFDTRIKKWLGKGAPTDGPCSYDDPIMARAAATVANTAFKVPFGTIHAAPLPAADEWHCVDTIESELTGEEAMQLLEQQQQQQ